MQFLRAAAVFAVAVTAFSFAGRAPAQPQGKSDDVRVSAAAAGMISQPDFGVIRQSDLPLRITDSGVWTVAEDLFTEGEQLTVAAPDVTIELAGYTIDGGIWVESGDGLTVRGGTMTADWPYYLINGDPPDCATVESLLLTGGAEDVGIELGNDAVVQGVTVQDAYFEKALIVGDDSQVTDIDVVHGDEYYLGAVMGDRCVVRNYRAYLAAGIEIGADCLVEDCHIRSDFLTAIEAGPNARLIDTYAHADEGSSPSDNHRGVVVGDGSWVVRCDTGGPISIVGGANVRVIDCTASAYEDAIVVGPGSLVQGCLITYADNSAVIRVQGDSRVIGNRLRWEPGSPYGIIAEGDRNHIEGNQVGGYEYGIGLMGSQNTVIGNTITGYPEAAIHVAGQGNRIEGNQVEHVWIGVRAIGAGNVIVRNMLGPPERNAFELPPGNLLGEVIDLTNGGMLPPNNCWANIIEGED